MSTLTERYIGLAQHRIVVDIIKALSHISPAEHMDSQVAVLAAELGEDVPEDAMFEDAIGDLVAAYATKKIDAARSNVRKMYRQGNHCEEGLYELDPDWKTYTNIKVTLPAQAAVAKPAVPQASVAKPTVPQAAVAKPAVSQAAVAKPAVTKPAVSQAAVAKPAAAPAQHTNVFDHVKQSSRDNHNGEPAARRRRVPSRYGSFVPFESGDEMSDGEGAADPTYAPRAASSNFVWS